MADLGADKGEWGPLIPCDGVGVPPQLNQIGPGTKFEAIYEEGDASGIQAGQFDSVGPEFPGWFWRWHKTTRGFLWSRETLKYRQCDDPEFAPIAFIRIWRPGAMVQLTRLAAAPVDPDIERVEA